MSVTSPATVSESRLLRHLGWVVALKLLVLAGLWQAFVADQRVAVDEATVAAHQQLLLGAPAAAGHRAAPAVRAAVAASAAGPGAITTTTPLDGERP